MPRKVPIPPPQLKEPTLDTWTLKLRTITPLFGGSAIPRQVDRENPVRAASIRGHLRFWWRATAGAHYATAEELFRAEEEIWGSAERHGRVALRVVEQSEKGLIKPSELVPNEHLDKSGPKERFFLHAFNKKKNSPEAPGLKAVEFTLELTLNLSESDKEHLRRALRAWIAFGGIGARTRRGVGALEVTEDSKNWLPSSPEQLSEWFSIQAPRGVFHTTLAGAVICLGEAREPEPSDPYKGHAPWRELGRFWTRFRKGHFLRNPATGRPMAYSPMTGSKWLDHKTLQSLRPGHHRIALVKPYLGLPIVYQRFGKSFSGTLEASHPQGRRMASPVILKPMAFADGTVRPAVILLKGPAPTRIKVNGKAYALEVPVHDPVLKALGARDPLEAVRRAAHIQGFTQEVHL